MPSAGIGIHGKYGAGKDYFFNVLKEQSGAQIAHISFGELLKAVCAALLFGTPLKSSAFITQEQKEQQAKFFSSFELDFCVKLALECVLDREFADMPKEEWRQLGPYMGGKTAGEIFDILYGELKKRVRCNEKSQEIEFDPPMTRGELLQFIGTDVFRNKVHPDAWVWIVETRIKKFERDGINWALTDVRFPNEVDLVRNNGGVVLRIEAPELTKGARDHKHPSETACDHLELPTFVNDRSPAQNKAMMDLCAPPLWKFAQRVAKLPVRKSRFYGKI